MHCVYCLLNLFIIESVAIIMERLCKHPVYCIFIKKLRSQNDFDVGTQFPTKINIVPQCLSVCVYFKLKSLVRNAVIRINHSTKAKTQHDDDILALLLTPFPKIIFIKFLLAISYSLGWFKFGTSTSFLFWLAWATDGRRLRGAIHHGPMHPT